MPAAGKSVLSRPPGRTVPLRICSSAALKLPASTARKDCTKRREKVMKITAVKEEYLHICASEKKLSPHTVKAYTATLKNFESFAHNLGLSEIEDITRKEIHAYIQSLNETLKASSVLQKKAIVHTFFEYAVSEEFLEYSPFDHVNVKIRKPVLLPKSLSEQEIHKIINAAYDDDIGSWDGNSGVERIVHVRDCLILETMFATGIRVQELCDLTMECMDFTTGTIRIFGKGRKERKAYIVQPSVLMLYKDYFAFRFLMGFHDSHVFITRHGKQMSTQSIRFLLGKYTDLAGIKKRVTPHMIRHTFATLLLEEGTDIKFIQELLGHSSITTTQIYLHINERAIRSAVTDNHPRRRMDIHSPYADAKDSDLQNHRPPEFLPL